MEDNRSTNSNAHNSGVGIAELQSTDGGINYR